MFLPPNCARDPFLYEVSGDFEFLVFLELLLALFMGNQSIIRHEQNHRCRESNYAHSGGSQRSLVNQLLDTKLGCKLSRSLDFVGSFIDHVDCRAHRNYDKKDAAYRSNTPLWRSAPA
jgi:hypothetical protein